MELKYDVKKLFGTLSENSKGWKKELSLVSWNEREPKYDIREWDSEHKRMSKGVTFTLEEIKKLKKLLNNIDFESEK